MQLTCGGNDVVRYLVGIGLWCVYVLFLLFFYHSFIASIAFIILPVYYGRITVWNKTWLIDWIKKEHLN